MNFFMELLSSLTIRDILAVAQLLTTSLDYICLLYTSLLCLCR